MFFLCKFKYQQPQNKNTMGIVIAPVAVRKVQNLLIAVNAKSANVPMPKALIPALRAISSTLAKQ